MDSTPPPPDAQIDPQAALEYWSSIPATVNGVLGGYPEVSRIDLSGSLSFLRKLQRKSKTYPANKLLPRVVDCGAGIGRVTKGFLGKVAECVDIVEPVVKLTDVISKGEEFAELREQGRVGEIVNKGLQEWTPTVVYDVIWNQWCLGQLKDVDLIAYFKRLRPWVEEEGWIVVKENMSNEVDESDVYDQTDSSVTRSDANFRALFGKAGLRIVQTELLRGMPKGLYPVRTYALKVVEGKRE